MPAGSTTCPCRAILSATCCGFRATCQRRWRASGARMRSSSDWQRPILVAGWQRDLALTLGRVALVLARLGAKSEATAAFEQARAITARLIEQSPDNATLPKDLAWFEKQTELKK